MGTTVSVMGGNSFVYVGGDGTVYAGAGHDTIYLGGSGEITQGGTAGFDTINLGAGSDTIFEAGHATVSALFGSALVAGGSLTVFNSGIDEIASTGNATLIGGLIGNSFVGGSGSVSMQGGLGSDTFHGGTAFDTMTGGAGSNYFEFSGGGYHTITDFVSGQDKLYVEGMQFSDLKADITYNNGNAYINVGNTHIELLNVPKNSLTSTDIIKTPK